MNNLVKIKIPATTANLGAGFDVLGIALNLYNLIEVSISEQDKIEIFELDKINTISTNKDNLLYQCIRRIFDEVGEKIPKLEIKVHINIPVSRGLGSSSSAIVGGLMAGNYLLKNKLSKEELLHFANEIEGHPDNVTPCLFGGITTSLLENKKVYFQQIRTNLPLSFVVGIPNFELSTKLAREVLPETVPYSDAIFNLSRVSFLIKGLLSNDLESLKLGFNDKLHEPYRAKLITGFDELKKSAIKNGALGFVLSGAGPAVLAITLENENTIGLAMQNIWKKFGIDSTYKVLKINERGAYFIN